MSWSVSNETEMKSDVHPPCRLLYSRLRLDLKATENITHKIKHEDIAKQTNNQEQEEIAAAAAVAAVTAAAG